jgi:hypothetical protein
MSAADTARDFDAGCGSRPQLSGVVGEATRQPIVVNDRDFDEWA